MHIYLLCIIQKVKNYLEEEWLFEAISETYIPYLQILEKLEEEKKLILGLL